MATFTISLDGERADRLKRLAEQRGETPEQTIEHLVDDVLDESKQRQQTSSGYNSTLDLAGIINDPTIKPLSAREIDEVIAEEMVNPHADE